MDINSLVGKTVRLNIVGVEFQDPFIRPKVAVGEPTLTLVSQVESVDEFGIWIKVDKFPVYNSVERKREEHVALVLLRYEYISSIVHFPEVEEDTSKSSKIGFIPGDD
ncbi:hypothetical protein J7L01_03355 [bacterium]|nr:hypothetical protein [bacterium]